MREFKFRAWDKKAKKMRSVSLLKTDNETPREFQAQFYFEGNLTYRNDIVLMQYTGCQDNNGIELYEGDILKTKYDEHIGIIRFGEYEFAIDIHLVNDVIYTATGTSCGFFLEIIAGIDSQMVLPWEKDAIKIGNIFENPELLEKKEENEKNDSSPKKQKGVFMKKLVERNNNNDKVLANYVCEYKFKKMYPEIDRMLRVIHFNNNFNRLIQMKNILTYIKATGDIDGVEKILELQTPEFKKGYEFGVSMVVIE